MGIIESTILAIASAIVGAVLGGYAGFFFANKKENRLVTIQFLRDVLSDDFTKKRIRILDYLEDPEKDLAEFASSREQSFRDIRQDVVEVFNTYDIICGLLSTGDIDFSLFDKYLRKIIRYDYTEVDEALRQIEVHQLHNNGPLRRPFFPEIAKVVGRGN